jgi:HPr kinase/phosphorylase
MITIHATTVSLDGRGVILRGPSGSGKSDLALRLVNEGALLVADDQTVLFIEGGRLMAQAPKEIAGKMEVRGVGIVHLGPPAIVPVFLLIDMADPADVPRMADFAPVELVGQKIPRIHLAPFEMSAPAKVKLALRALLGS